MVVEKLGLFGNPGLGFDGGGMGSLVYRLIFTQFAHFNNYIYSAMLNF